MKYGTKYIKTCIKALKLNGGEEHKTELCDQINGGSNHLQIVVLPSLFIVRHIPLISSLIIILQLQVYIKRIINLYFKCRIMMAMAPSYT